MLVNDQRKMTTATASKHQKLRSVDIKKPLINSWLKSHEGPGSGGTHKRGNSMQDSTPKNKLKAQSSSTKSGVTNITNIIYNFNMTPGQ